jgi:hypothetical protein
VNYLFELKRAALLLPHLQLFATYLLRHLQQRAQQLLEKKGDKKVGILLVVLQIHLHQFHHDYYCIIEQIFSEQNVLLQKTNQMHTWLEVK